MNYVFFPPLWYQWGNHQHKEIPDDTFTICVSYGIDPGFNQGTRVWFAPCKNCNLFCYVKQNKM